MLSLKHFLITQVYQAPDRRCETKMVDDLLEQLTHEVEMDSRLPDPDQEIEKRLRQLREKKGLVSSHTFESLSPFYFKLLLLPLIPCNFQNTVFKKKN